jgi:hypothetical protein
MKTININVVQQGRQIKKANYNTEDWCLEKENQKETKRGCLNPVLEEGKPQVKKYMG